METMILHCAILILLSTSISASPPDIPSPRQRRWPERRHRGVAGEPMVSVAGVQDVTLANLVVDIHDYAGPIYYGPSQFYSEPKAPRFVSHGTRGARVILAGHFWYGAKPRFELGPEVKLTMIANRDVPDAGVDDEALKCIAAALDDLRRLGELDCELAGTGIGGEGR